MPAPETIRQLVKRFEENLSSYRSGKYNETQLRREFLDPLFEALGWDVVNKQGHAEAYKEVVHEDSLEVEGATKAPDYAFRIGGQRKFFVEAKKPSVKIESDIYPAFQLRRYSWSAKLPLGVLSDFEEFAVYESRSKPDKKDKASTGRVALYSYRDYIEKWDEIADIFSRDAILKGSFDKFAEGVKGKKGTAEVDDAFLAEIERWRELLAKNFALRNGSLTTRELNYAVQMTIDRIIFLRICEDRGIERYGRLKDLVDSGLDTGRDDRAPTRPAGGVYEGLVQIFQQADARYNSGLFHFPTGRTAKEEKNASSAADSLTLSLNVDDKVLRDILGSLYYPESPYVFSEIPSDILGQVYERFLGKVIRLTSGHQAKVEEKPEVRKAGGVYYTPTYIVEYIVKNTVGRIINSTYTPKEVSKLKILDPACGSGTFPLGAYQYLLDWHLKWYSENDPEKWAKGKNPAIFESTRSTPTPTALKGTSPKSATDLGEAGRGWRLTTAEKKRILLNNIYGVDIDPQAVEVTKLSLLLKVLEGESEQTIGSQLALIQERALPDLGNNIKCGNSLIGPDYYEGHQLTMGFADEEERYRVNAFDWKAEFSQVFIQGGFDVVIGNPPYIRIQTLQETSPIDVGFFKKKYQAASKGNYDIYVVFVERGLSVLNEKGRLGFILPHKFFNAQYGEPLRGVIAKGKHLAKVVHFGDQQVFENATTYTCLMFLDKTGHDEFDFEKVQDLESWRGKTSKVSEGKINVSRVTKSEWNFSLGASAGLFEKLAGMPVKLGNVTSRIYQGPITSADTVYLFKEFKDEDDKTVFVFSKELQEWRKLEKKVLRKVIRSGSIGRYWAQTTAYVLFPYVVNDNSGTLLTTKELQINYPLAWAYLEKNKQLLENREKGAFKDSQWYRFGRNQNLGMWEQPKLLIPYMITDLSTYFDASENYYFINVTTGGYGITTDESKGSYHYLCGLLNSNLLNFQLKQVSTTFHGGYFAANKQYIEQLPIHPIDFSDPADKARHDKMVSLVERMLELHKALTPSDASRHLPHFPQENGGGRVGVGRTPQDKERVEREIRSTDEAIDRLVYELYGLTEEEIKIVEGAK